MTSPFLRPITFGDLLLMVDQFPYQFPTVRPTPEAIQFSLSATVLRTLLSDEWCDKNLSGRDDADPYLIPRNDDDTEHMKVQARIVALGEMIFNLQSIPGATGRFENLQKASLEVAISDLESARLLALAELRFRFVIEQQRKGEDYDIEISPDAHSTLCCESKCKVESTVPTKFSLLESLNKGRKQLPESSPGVLFMKLPESWIKTSGLSDIVKTTLDEFFRNTRRVVEIVFHWEEWNRQNTGPLFRLAKFREEVNKASRFYRPELVNFLREFSPLWKPPSWRRFRDAVESRPGR